MIIRAKTDSTAVAEPVTATAAPMPEKRAVVGRDFQAEAQGKTRCALMEAAITGLGASAGMVFDWHNPETPKKYVDICRAVAEEAFKFVFPEEK